MREKKQLGKHKRLLSLLLALVLMCGMIPIESVLAVENEALQKTEAAAEGMTEQDTNAAPDDGDIENTVSDAEEAHSKEIEPATYASISGVLWLDTNADGTYDGDEQPIAGYPVYLYAEGDSDTAIQTAATDADGKYAFADIEPGSYIVGVKSGELGTDKYLLPLVGIVGDNKFADWSEDYTEIYSEPVEIDAETVITDISAGLRTPPVVQPMNVGIQTESDTEYTVNSTVIGFAGREWWVIGDYVSGVQSQEVNSVTLLMKNSIFEEIRFHSSLFVSGGSDNYGNDSVLQRFIVGLFDNLFLSGNANEKSYVLKRETLDLPSEPDGVKAGWPAIEDQPFWPLSYAEFMKINKLEVQLYPNHGVYGLDEYDRLTGKMYWLRTTNDVGLRQVSLISSYGKLNSIDPTAPLIHPRPAFYLNLSSVLFTSGTNGEFGDEGDGVKTATAGSPSLEAVTQPTGAIKLTMLDEENLHRLSTTTMFITAPITGGDNVTFNYSGAATGANRSVSVIISERGTGTAAGNGVFADTGEILYYGRPVDLSSGGDSGTATFTVPSGLDPGDYDMWIFNEEVNGDNYTDYASTPVLINFQIVGPTAEKPIISDITSTGASVSGIFDLNGGTLSSDNSSSFYYGTSASPTTALAWTSNTDTSAESSLSGLTPNTLYYVRNYVKTGGGDASSSDAPFVTSPAAPAISASATSTTSASVTASIPDTGNQSYSVKIEYSTDSTFATGVNTALTTTSGTSWTPTLSGLTENTTYYVKITFTNTTTGGIQNAGLSTTATTSFTTSSATTNVTITKTVTGDYGDKTKSWAFTVTLTDAGGTPLAGPFNYENSIGTDSPTTGTLNLTGGVGTITLIHEQSITIQGVPTDAKITIVETVDTANYTTSYKDSGSATPTASNPGGTIGPLPVGSANRTFAFENARNSIIPGGIFTGSNAILLLSLLSLLVGVAGLTIIAVYRRRTRVC